MAKLSLIEGIGEAYELKLNEVGIKSIEGLLDACATKKGRDALAEKTGISEKLSSIFKSSGSFFGRNFGWKF